VDVIINCDGFPQYYEVAYDSVTTLEEYLLPPDFLPYPPSTYPCGNEIAFVIKNENQGSYTEVWRSRFPDTGFVLVDSIFSWSDSFLDTGLGSRKTYYYKLRAVKGTAVSEFSEVQSFQSGATFYNPILTTTLLPDNTIEIKLLDRSYLDTRYEILGDASPFVEGAVSSDSGVVHTFIDASVVPGGTYGYYVNVELLCDGLPMLFNVATDSITIPAVPEGPVVTGFTLVDPYTDQDIRVLHDYDTINATNRPTIRADASSDARSVRFFLNGKRISTSNTVPHSLYGDAKGNYNPGKLKPGDYTLTAIPYTKRNANGVEGTSLTIHFTVYKDEPQSALARDGQMETENQTRFFPNPLISQSVIEVASVPESKVKIQIMDHQGNVLTTMFNGKLDEEGILRKEVNRNQFVTGTYLLAVTINGKTTVTRFIVE
jgi:hypothetical protein